MALVDDNAFPKVILAEGSAPSSPSAGQFKLFVDSADHLLKYKNSAGTVTTLGAGFANPMTTSGDIIYGGASGAATRLAKGTDGDVLTLASGLPSWAAAGGGGSGALVLLEQHTASGSATLDFTTFISSTYDEYRIEIVGIVPATNGVSLHLQMGTGAGPTWDTTSGHYRHAASRFFLSGAATQGSASDSKIIIDGMAGIDTLSNAGLNGGLTGTFTLFNPASGSAYPTVLGDETFYNVGNDYGQATLNARYLQATAITALRFVASSGNIASGTIRVYGIAK